MFKVAVTTDLQSSSQSHWVLNLYSVVSVAGFLYYRKEAFTNIWSRIQFFFLLFSKTSQKDFGRDEIWCFRCLMVLWMLYDLIWWNKFILRKSRVIFSYEEHLRDHWPNRKYVKVLGYESKWSNERFQNTCSNLINENKNIISS